MLHRITGRATKCGPSTISAIAGVPTHQAAAVIRRLYNHRAVNGVATDELAAALVELGFPPNYALRHPRYPNGRWKESEAEFDRLFANVPFDVRSVSLGAFLDVAPSGSWAIAAARHWIAYADGFVADSGFPASRNAGPPFAIPIPGLPAAASSKRSASPPRPHRFQHQGNRNAPLPPPDLCRDPAYTRKTT